MASDAITVELAPNPPEAAAAPVDAPVPVAVSERAASVDTLRGVAVLGILLMNIVAFGLPDAADDDPTQGGGATGANLAFWLVNHVLFEGKMRALFSMLFGAGFLLLTTRVEKRDPTQAADIYYRRTLWLIALGLGHSLFLWDGDILYTYGTAGLVLYPLRRLRPAVLLGAGLVLLALIPAKAALYDREIQSQRTRAEAAKAAEEQGKELTDEQEEAKDDWDETRKELKPSQREIERDIAAHQAGYGTIFSRRLKDLIGLHTSHQPGSELLDAAGMMLIGMALLKLGVLTLAWPREGYLALLVLGYGIGIPLNLYTANKIVAAEFDPINTYLVRHVFYDAGRLTVALGHLGLILLVCQAGWLPRLMWLLGCVGRMALTNYLLQSVICTTIFYGYGWGLYNELSRSQLLYVVFGVWAFQLALSPVWLRYFRFGPVEWAWRSLTYWRRQPFVL
jgi:uncharacterized protein